MIRGHCFSSKLNTSNAITMLTLSLNTPKPPFLSTAFLPSNYAPPISVFIKPTLSPRPISALIIPPSSSGSRPPDQMPSQLIIPSSSGPRSLQHQQSTQHQQLYQPFRLPPSPLPEKYRNLDTSSRLEVLTNRLGLWFEYAPLIPTLTKDGFAPSILEEITGITGAEQNLLIVGSQVRESLVQSGVDEETLSYFDTTGKELLYEIRIIPAAQRVAAAEFLVRNNFGAKQTQEMARAMKDFPLRRADPGWSRFDADSPGDCLAFSHYRLALEYEAIPNKKDLKLQTLQKGLEFVVSESARALIEEELEGKAEVKVSDVDNRVTVPLVRMQLGELAESTVVVVLPVCMAEEAEVEGAPWNCGGIGDFGIVEAEKAWRRWVVLPGWQPVAALERGGVAVASKNGSILPWKESKKNKAEPILVVTDRQRKEVAADNNFYLVAARGANGSVKEQGLKVESGGKLKEKGIKESLGVVVLVVRPPGEDDLQLNEEDWE